MIWRGQDDSRQGPEHQAPAQEAGAVARSPDGPGPGPGPDSVGARVEAVLDAAERAAHGIREDAEEWARRYEEDSRRRADQHASDRIREISALTDNLVARARAVAQQSDELIAALDDAGRRVIAGAPRQRTVAEAGQPSTVPLESEPALSPSAIAQPDATLAQPVPPPSAAREPEAPYRPAPAEPPRPASGPASVSEGARLLATQMAVAGSSRDDVARRLRKEFGIEDSTPILDEIGI